MPNQNHICVICNEIINNNNLTIQCDGCKQYLHVDCSQIDNDEAKRITRQRTKGVKFFCKICNKSHDNFTELKLMLMNISDRLTKLENASIELPPQKFEDIVREVKERVQRENNIIIYGVPEESAINATSDIDTVQSIMSTCNPNQTLEISPNNVMRIGTKTEDKIRPLRVIFNNPFMVTNILRQKHKLRSKKGFSKVYLKNDETRYQRNFYLQCKETLKSRLDNGEANLSIKYIRGVPTIVSIKSGKKNVPGPAM